MRACPLCGMTGVGDTSAPVCPGCYQRLPHRNRMQLDYWWNRRRAAHQQWQEHLARAIDWYRENSKPEGPT